MRTRFTALVAGLAVVLLGTAGATGAAVETHSDAKAAQETTLTVYSSLPAPGRLAC